MVVTDSDSLGKGSVFIITAKGANIGRYMYMYTYMTVHVQYNVGVYRYCIGRHTNNDPGRLIAIENLRV